MDQGNVDAQWQALNYWGVLIWDGCWPSSTNLWACSTALAWRSDRRRRRRGGVGLDLYPRSVVIVNGGAILCTMGKAARAGEPDAFAAYLRSVDVPILGRIEPPGTLEGGDVCWIDERTVAVGEGYRTNAEGIRQFRELLGDRVDEVIPVPLPHWNGPDECLHLLSFISPVDHDLAVVYSRLMPVPFRQWLIARGIRLIEVPDEEYDSFACNVLAVAPGKVIMIAGNPITQSRLEAAGVEVHTFSGQDLCIKGGGGPTCLTRPIVRFTICD
ncbi:MAG: arginine deiminase family protein [Caldilineaceae bacterium]